jgi:antitoxin FitA
MPVILHGCLEQCNRWLMKGFTLRFGRAHPCAINDCNDIIAIMASITIRNLEETTKRKLKIRAAMNGRSMEQEAREILSGALREKSSPHKRKSGADLVKRIREIFEPLGGVDLEPFPREPMRDPDWLKDWKA